MTDTVSTVVRDVTLNLVGYTRALELCARMNRETEVLDFIDRIEPGEVLYDLGACEGRFALYAALRGIRCYAFEPEALNFKALLENLALNGAKAEYLLTPLNYAVGESNHQSTIKIGQPWAGGHHRVLSDVSSRVDLDFDFVSEQAVEVVGLDAFINNRNLPAPNYLKVDVDGSELSFLKGAQQTLASPGLKAIIFELLERDASYQEAIALLESLGFRVVEKHEVEPGLFNVVFERGTQAPQSVADLNQASVQVDRDRSYMGITANDTSTLKSTEATTSNQSEPTAPASPAGIDLPTHPLVTIEPSGRWGVFNLRDLWSYRELLYFLIWRDVKVRYKQTALGVAWAIIQPLFTMLIFTLFFGRLAGVPSDNIPYPVFAYAGLLPWTFFANAISNSGNSLVGSANLITKVYFPRMIIPAAAVGAGLVDLGISFVVLIPLMFYYGVTITWSVLMLPVLVVLTALLALGVGMWLSALNVKYRDVRFALPFLVQLWMFVSPVIYPTSFLPQDWRLLFALNPMTGVIEGYRSALFGHAFNWKALVVATSITLAVLVFASFSFRRMEKSFADIV